MADFTLVKTSSALKDSASVAAGGNTSATLDLRTSHGAVLSMRIVNGSTGPSAPCIAYVGISHNSGATPSASISFGTDWFLLATLMGTTTNSDTRDFPPIEIPAGVQHVEVYFTGHTGQAVTVTAKVTVITKVVSA